MANDDDVTNSTTLTVGCSGLVWNHLQRLSMASSSYWNIIFSYDLMSTVLLVRWYPLVVFTCGHWLYTFLFGLASVIINFIFNFILQLPSYNLHLRSSSFILRSSSFILHHTSCRVSENSRPWPLPANMISCVLPLSPSANHHPPEGAAVHSLRLQTERKLETPQSWFAWTTLPFQLFRRFQSSGST